MGNPHAFYKMGLVSEDVAQEVFDEANAAHDKHGEQSMLYGSDEKSLRILMEEVGECAREMNELALGNKSQSDYDYDLARELYQVAAMAITWVEKIRAR